jgi:hypothetical protein
LLLLLKLMGHGDDLGREPTPTGIQYPLLGIRQAGEIGVSEFLKLPFGGVELRVPFGRRGGQGRAALDDGRRLRAARIAQKRFAHAGLRNRPIAGQERLGLTRRKGVALGGVGQANLFDLAQRAQRQRNRQRQAAAVQSGLKLGGQSAKERQAALDPELSATQKLSDRRQRQMVLVRQRSHDPCLIHGAGGLARNIGFQKPRFHGDPCRDRLDEDGNLLAPFGTPERQPFKAVQDLECAVGCGSDSQGKRRQIAGTRALSPQRRKRRSEFVDGYVHGYLFSSGRI